MSHHHALGKLAVELAGAASFDQSVSHVVEFAAHTFDTELAGITLIRNGGKTFETAGWTSPVIRAADDLQARLREGPCVDTSVQSRHTVSNAIASDPRWPRWGRAAAELGLGSIMSSALHAGDHRIGALNVYGSTGREFTREELEIAQVLAYHASAALKTAQQIEGLTLALDSRTVIGQAQGILMERYKVDSGRAFTILRRHSQQENIRLSRLARVLVETFEQGPAAPLDEPARRDD